MMDSSTFKAWGPAVEISTAEQLFDSNSSGGSCLRATLNDCNEQYSNNQLRSLNRTILDHSQSYNSTAKPFSYVQQQASYLKDQTQQTQAGISTSAIASHQISPKKFDSLQGGEKMDSRPTSSEIAQSQAGTSSQQHQASLIHDQYNSPLNLYSMDNIRKTIEAHTELIAPGVKGVNFMKQATPVNKQSEVYKLVKEEEEREQLKRISPNAARVSPISGEPLRPLQATQSVEPVIEQIVENQGFPIANQSIENSRRIHNSQLKQQLQRAMSNRNEGALRCQECGLAIMGPFTRVQGRDIHAHCFNCTTCGNSLKNKGFFTINEKLYCDIHARQVAKMLHLNYNFKEASNVTDHQTSADSEASVTPNTVKVNVIPPIDATLVNKGQQDQSRSASEPMTHHEPKQSSSDYSRLLSETSQRVSMNTTHNQLVKTSITSTQTKSYSGQENSTLRTAVSPSARAPICGQCQREIHGPYILAGRRIWCKPCSQTSFNCYLCRRSLLNIGFIEDGSSNRYYCEPCFEACNAPVCSKCNTKIRGDCLNALGKQWHPTCFVCGHCRQPFGNSSFYLEDNVPYCERDWNLLFTTKCYSCSNPIEAGDKWIEALDKNYHSNCFRCSSCRASLEGSVFYCKGGKPYCRLHAR